jgi:hypothetical protein
MTQPPWITLEPACELDGTRYAWEIVLTFDPDWQDFELTNGRFQLHISDDMVKSITTITERAYA